jgi:hypothetical protein
VDVNPGDKRCRVCDPANDMGCTAGEHCSVDFTCGP